MKSFHASVHLFTGLLAFMALIQPCPAPFVAAIPALVEGVVAASMSTMAEAFTGIAAGTAEAGAAEAGAAEVGAGAAEGAGGLGEAAEGAGTAGRVASTAGRVGDAANEGCNMSDGCSGSGEGGENGKDGRRGRHDDDDDDDDEKDKSKARQKQAEKNSKLLSEKCVTTFKAHPEFKGIKDPNDEHKITFQHVSPACMQLARALKKGQAAKQAQAAKGNDKLKRRHSDGLDKFERKWGEFKIDGPHHITFFNSRKDRVDMMAEKDVG